MTNDLISIIMPVYNTEKYINESIDSVLSQTYGKYELIIIDDGSTDSTVAKILKYKDKRIKLYKENHSGFIASLNKALAYAEGTYIARMDGDDIIDKDKLKIQIDFLKKNKEISLVGTNYYYISEKGITLTEKKMPEKNEEIEFMMPIVSSVNHGSMLTYKEVLNSVGGYSNKYYCEDVVLFMKLLEKGYKMYNIQQPLYKYRLVNKPNEYYEKHYIDYYNYSLKYLNNFYSENEKLKSADYFFRMGLLEYYMGSMKYAKKYFTKCMKYSPYRKKILLRYFPILLLGDNIVNHLRNKKYMEKINYFISNKLDYDTNLITANIKYK